MTRDEKIKQLVVMAELLGHVPKVAFDNWISCAQCRGHIFMDDDPPNVGWAAVLTCGVPRQGVGGSHIEDIENWFHETDI